MGEDKSQLVYPKLSREPQRVKLVQLLESSGLGSFLSCRAEQPPSESLFTGKIIFDREELIGGPGVGILSAHLAHPEVNWLVLACDFPFASKSAIEKLLQTYADQKKSVCYRHEDGTIEPLFSIWSTADLQYFHIQFLAGSKSPKRALEERGVFSILPLEEKILENINSPREAAAHAELLK